MHRDNVESKSSSSGPTVTSPSLSIDDPKVVALVAHYQATLDAGKNPDRAEILSKFPGIADELNDCLDALEFVVHAAHEASQTTDSRGPEIQPLRELGDFRLVREIGRGGMGVVYEAEQLSLGRRVALKVLAFASTLDKRQIERFKIEACAAAALKHPHIVSVYSVGCERGVHYYAMELVEGQSLAEVIVTLRDQSGNGESQRSKVERQNGHTGGDRSSGHGRLIFEEPPANLPKQHKPEVNRGTSDSRHSTSQCDTSPIAALSTQRLSNRTEFYRGAARLCIQAADALQYAHQEGVVHRDIKPSNLLLDPDGNLWITDFGLARFPASGSLTRSGDLLGTPRYMSPEQLDRGKVVDQRSDVYSLGLTLYELITCQPAFRGESREQIAERILSGEVTPPSRLDHSIPRDLETIVLKATATDVTDRYTTAGELKQDLQRFVENKPIAARRSTHTERLWRWAKRNPLVATLTGTVAALLVLMSVASSLLAWRSMAQAAAQELVLYARDMQAANVAIEQGEYPRAEQILLDWQRKDQKEHLRNFEWNYLWKKSHADAARRTLHLSIPVFDAEYSADASFLAVSTMSPTVNVFDARTGRVVRSLKSSSAEVTRLLRQPGTNILVGADKGGHVTFWEFDTGHQVDQLTLDLPTSRNQINSIAVSPDGRLVAVGAGHPKSGGLSDLPATVHVWNRKTRKWTVLEGFTGQVCLQFTVDGQSLITGCHQGLIKVWDTANWTTEWEERVSFGGITAMSISPDGLLLATAAARPRERTYDAQIDVWEVDTWKTRLSTFQHDDIVWDLAFSSDSQLLAAGMERRRIQLHDFRTGAFHVMPSAHSGKVLGVTFTPDDRYLVTCSGDNSARVWEVRQLLSPPEIDTVFRQHPGVIKSAKFVDRGETVCSLDREGNVFVWDTKSGLVRHRFEIEMTGVNSATLAVSPDKRWLAIKRGNWPPTDAAAKLDMFALPQFEHKHSLELPQGSIASAPDAFSSDSTRIALLCKRHVLLMNVQTMQIYGKLGPFAAIVKGAAFSADGLLACCTDEGKTYVYDATSLQLVHTIDSDEGFTHGVAFSPDAKTLATGGAEGSIKLWDTRTFRPLGQCGPQHDFIIHLAFSPDSQRIVSASGDGKVRIWDPRSGEQLLALPVPEWWPGSGEFCDDGSAFVAATGRTAVVFRGAEPTEWDQLRIERLPHFGCDR